MVLGSTRFPGSTNATEKVLHPPLMFIWPSRRPVCPSICLSVCLSILLDVLPACLFICLSVCLFICLSVCLSVWSYPQHSILLRHYLAAYYSIDS